MAFDQDQYHYTHPRSLVATSRYSPLHSPYAIAAPAYTPALTMNNQAAVDPRFRSSFEVPNYSSLTNSALVDALLAPSSNGQEQDSNSLFLPADIYNNNQDGPSRKHARSADSTGSELSDLDHDESRITQKQSVNSAARKKPRRQPKKQSAAVLDADGDYIEDDKLFASEMTPQRKQRKPRRSGRAKKSPIPRAPSPVQKDQDAVRKPQASVPADKKTVKIKKERKPRAGRLVRKKPIGTSVPKTLEEAGPADRMMWEWKNQGRNWEEIRTEWKRITGIEPGGSSLSVRYIKLVENLARNGAAGDLELLRFKKEAEEELLAQLWNKVAEKMLAYSPESEYNPKDLQKRYNMIVRSGYDIEKLIADDKVKRDEEKKEEGYHEQRDQFVQDEGPPVPRVTVYSDPVANAAAAVLSQEKTEDDDCGTRHRVFDDLHSRISGQSPNIFENMSLLQHEVDGLNEPEGFYGDTYPNPVTQQTTLMSEDGVESTSTDVELWQTSKHDLRMLSPHQKYLVAYDSESD